MTLAISIFIVSASLFVGFVLGMMWTHFLYFAGRLKFQEDEDGIYPYVESDITMEETTERTYVLYKVTPEKHVL